jgi:hypothetical protein
MRDYLIETIQKTFEVGLQQAECLYGELLQCTRKKNLVRVIYFTLLQRSGDVTQRLYCLSVEALRFSSDVQMRWNHRISIPAYAIEHQS